MTIDDGVHAAVLRVELRLRGVRSLKEKRHIMRSVTTQVVERCGVAAAEVGYQDKWQRAAIGIAAVAPQAGRLGEILQRTERHLYSRLDIEVIDVARSHLGPPE